MCISQIGEAAVGLIIIRADQLPPTAAKLRQPLCTDVTRPVDDDVQDGNCDNDDHADSVDDTGSEDDLSRGES